MAVDYTDCVVGSKSGRVSSNPSELGAFGNSMCLVYNGCGVNYVRSGGIDDRVIEFRILSTIRDIETIAAGHGVYIRRHLERTHGTGRWRKKKGVATVELADGTICEAEIHWYEAHGIGRKDFKIKWVIND